MACGRTRNRRRHRSSHDEVIPSCPDRQNARPSRGQHPCTSYLCVDHFSTFYVTPSAVYVHPLSGRSGSLCLLDRSSSPGGRA